MGLEIRGTTLMIRLLFAAVCVFLAMGITVAAEIKGRIIKVDAPTRKITLSVEDKEREFTLPENVRILGPKGTLKDGLRHKVFQNEKALKKGIPATLTTDSKDDKETVTEIKLGGGKKKSE